MKNILRICLMALIFGGQGFGFSEGDPAQPVADEKTESQDQHDGHHHSRLSDEKIPLQVDKVPKRPRPLIELGEPFLGTGTLSPGIQLPTGAVWQPSLIAFGTVRTAFQTNGFEAGSGDSRTTELAARLDLFANLQLSGSERLVLGMRNLDQNGQFTSYVFDSDVSSREGGQSELNAEVGTLFFEGDFGEIFPNISPKDFKPTDIGFSIGRQPIFFQEGILINDTLDGIGITLNSLQPKKSSNFRSTFLYGWNNVDRNNVNQDSGNLFAIFNAVDFRRSTVELDLAYSSGGAAYQDLTAFGLSGIQRFGKVNTSFRLLGSSVAAGNTLGVSTPEKVEGLLLFSEVAWTPVGTHDHVYITSYWAIDQFSPVAMGPASGGPLGRAGINFASVGLGRYAAPLSAEATNVAGGALGYQLFTHHTRRQWLFEIATRIGTEADIEDAYAATVRHQVALGQRFVLIVDAYANHLEAFEDDTFFGGRVELQLRL